LGDEGDAFAVWSWSPDGKWLAGWVYTDAGTYVGVAIYNLESQQYKRLTNFGDLPVWLNDSRRLLFRGQSESELLLIDSESGSFEVVLSIPPDTVEGFSVSHDNRWIFFSRGKAEADIWMLTLNEERE
jgi:Tol biopolymer transport system component